MQKPQYHLFICSSFRANGEPKGVCFKKGADLVNYIQTEVSDRGIDAIVSTTGCLNACEKGPVLIVYPRAGGTTKWMKLRLTRSSTPWSKARGEELLDGM